MAVAKMAGLVIGDRLRFGVFRGRRLDADFGEPFVDVFYLRIPKVGALFVDRIAFEQLGVMFQVRTAAGGVGDDGVEFGWRKLIDVAAGEDLGELPFAVVGVK